MVVVANAGATKDDQNNVTEGVAGRTPEQGTGIAGPMRHVQTRIKNAGHVRWRQQKFRGRGLTLNDLHRQTQQFQHHLFVLLLIHGLLLLLFFLLG